MPWRKPRTYLALSEERNVLNQRDSVSEDRALTAQRIWLPEWYPVPV